MREYKEEEILRLAKRQGNKKRSYLLVDPLQAKHIPVSPIQSLEMMTALGEKLKARGLGKTLVIAFAETATAIGTQVAATIGDCLYLQTTREACESVENWLIFEEEHSHAVEQKVSRDYLEKTLRAVDTVALVDDELSTGKTLVNIVQTLRESFPFIREKRVIAASVVNRLSEENTARLKNAGIDCEYLVKLPETDYEKRVQGLETAGAAEAETDETLLCRRVFSEEKLPDPRTGTEIGAYVAACERFAKTTAKRLALADKKRVLVLGTEECMYPALALGREIERGYGKQTFCHATTRSPIGVLNESRYPIRNGCKLRSFYEAERDTYVYDLAAYDTAIVVTDSVKCERAAKQLFCALQAHGTHDFTLVKCRAFGSYKEEDVNVLLKDVTGLVTPLGTKEREAKIQTGTHYSEMLPIEYEPSEAYFAAYTSALKAYAPMTAQAVAAVSEKIVKDKGMGAAIVSLARAGTPIGVLIKRYIKRRYGFDVAHYSVSIIRGKGVDKNAMAYILARHKPEEIQFVDGWTGKGAICRQLDEAMREYAGVSSGLAVLSDPACVAEKWGTREDFLIASSCLNSTVSGLLSRTFCRADIIKEEDFHGAAFYADLQDKDVTYDFIEAVERCFDFSPVTEEAQDAQPTGAGLDEVRAIAEEFGVRDINLIKPSIGEATRVLLRRVPWKLLVHSKTDEAHLGHLYQLAKEKGVEVAEYPLKHYRACGIIRSLADN